MKILLLAALLVFALSDEIKPATAGPTTNLPFPSQTGAGAQVTPSAANQVKVTLVPAAKSMTQESGRILIRDPCGFKIVGTNNYTQNLTKDLTHEFRRLAFPTLDCSNHIYEAVDLILSDEEIVPLQNLTLDITAPTEAAGFLTANEGYLLNISETAMTLSAANYEGIARGLATLAQLIQRRKFTHATGKPGITYYIDNTPLNIQDLPATRYRGLLIDTSNHFLSVHSIIRVLDGMFLAKLNVLHWLFADKWAFSIKIKSFAGDSSRPRYTPEDVQAIMAAAKIRGITIVPEFSSPGRTHYLNNSEHKGLLYCGETDIICYEPACGQINPTLDESGVFVQNVLIELQTIFGKDSLFHLSGTDVNLACWEFGDMKAGKKPAAGTNYTQIGSQFMAKTRGFIPATSKAIYWHDTPFLKAGDYIQYWGQYSEFEAFRTKNKAQNLTYILSSYDTLRLDCGQGGVYGNNDVYCGEYVDWKKLITFKLPAADDILGAELLAYGELIDEHNIDFILWPRAFVFADNLWREQAVNQPMAEITRYQKMNEMYIDNGFLSAPIN